MKPWLEILVESYDDCEFVRHFGEDALRKMKAARHGLSICEPEPEDGALSIVEDESGRLSVTERGDQ